MALENRPRDDRPDMNSLGGQMSLFAIDSLREIKIQEDTPMVDAPDPEYFKAVSKTLVIAKQLNHQVESIDFPISPGALLEHEPLISLLDRENLSLFKLSLMLLIEKFPKEDIESIDQLVLLFYTSENKFNFTETVELQAVIHHFIASGRKPHSAAAELMDSYLAFWHLLDAFDSQKLASLIQSKDKKELLKYIMSKKTPVFPKAPPPGSPEAFSVDYCHSEWSLAHFAHFVFHDIIGAYNDDNGRNYHSLYFSLVQSSLFGKTRLVLKAGATNLNVVYCCVRQATSSGYPMSNQNVVSFLMQHWQVHELEIFILCIYGAAMFVFGEETAEPKFPPLCRLESNSHVKFSSFWDFVLTETTKCFKDRKKAEEYRLLFKNFQQSRDRKDGKDSFYRKVEINGRSVYVPTHLLIVFDESRWLLETVDDTSSIFRNLRKANQNLGGTDCVLVFIDTLSSVSHFQPAWSKDPSHRPTETRSLLLPPFYEILTADPSGFALEPVENRYQMLSKIFSFGRPGWKALFFRKIENVHINDIENALYYAKEKLALRFKAEPLSESAMIAVLAVRFGIIGISDHSLATSLISSHMGTGVYIGEDRLRMTVQYISEPILAEAACQILHGTASNNPKGGQSMDWTYPENGFNCGQISEYLNVFYSKYVSGLVDVGELGELLSRIVLSLSYDYVRLNMKAAKDSTEPIDTEIAKISLNASGLVATGPIGTDSYFTDSISLKEFFNVLVPESYRKKWAALMATGDVESKDGQGNLDPLSGIPVADLENFHVAFTSWIQLSTSNPKMFSQENLGNFYHRKCGIILPTNHKGLDLVIPMYNHAKKTYSYIVVQVKKKKSYGKERYAAAGEEMSPLECFMEESRVADYIALYMETDFKEDCLQGLDVSKALEIRRDYPRHILLLGTPQEFWETAVLGESMKNLQESNIDVIHSKTRCESLRCINTVMFMFEEYGCRCTTSNCSDQRCGCVKIGWACGDGCHPDQEGPCNNQHIAMIE